VIQGERASNSRPAVKEKQVIFAVKMQEEIESKPKEKA
jgi:hypothetical protein